jgi:hypothetical protein
MRVLLISLILFMCACGSSQMQFTDASILISGGGSFGAQGGGVVPMGGGGTFAGGGSAESDSGIAAGGTVAASVDSGAIDSGLVDSGIADAGPVDAGFRSAFVFIGKQRRRGISYDNGLSWQNDVSWVNPDGGYFRCGDCDHDFNSPTGVVVSNGFLLHATGHGVPGPIYRSRDGVNFSEVLQGTLITDLVAGNGIVLAAGRSFRTSNDNGLTWSNAATIDFRSPGNLPIFNARSAGFGGSDSGVFVIVADEGLEPDGGPKHDVRVSRDNALTWQRPTMTDGGFPLACGGSFVAGNGVIAFHSATSGISKVCYSKDNARTFDVATFATQFSANKMIFSAGEFFTWSYGKIHRSTDAVNWVTSNINFVKTDGGAGATQYVGLVASDNTGHFVSVANAYETEKFFKSNDGITWNELPLRDGGHPISNIVHITF